MSRHRSNAVKQKRDAAFARLDALPHVTLCGMPHQRIAGLATTSVVFVRAWIEARGHTDLIRINVTNRDAVFARLDALPIERIRGLPLVGVSGLARTSIPHVRAWVAARGLQRLLAYDQERWLIELYQQTPRLRYQDIADRMRLPYTTVCNRIIALQQAGVIQPRHRQ